MDSFSKHPVFDTNRGDHGNNLSVCVVSKKSLWNKVWYKKNLVALTLKKYVYKKIISKFMSIGPTTEENLGAWTNVPKWSTNRMLGASFPKFPSIGSASLPIWSVWWAGRVGAVLVWRRPVFFFLFFIRSWRGAWQWLILKISEGCTLE